MTRAVGFVLAVCVGAGGALPTVALFRCTVMNQLTTRACCAACSSNTAIARRCCEEVAARAAEVRAIRQVRDLGITPAPFLGMLPFAPATPKLLSRLEQLAALARSSPPGHRLDQLSTVLRI